MKTFLRRPGNKTNILKHIKPFLPIYERYIEPFVATGALYLDILPDNVVLNDLNTDIINIWKLVKENPEYLINEIDKFKECFLPLTNEEKLKLCKEITNNLKNLKGNQRTVMYLLMSYCSYNACIETRFSSLYRHIYYNNKCHIFTDKYKYKIRNLSNILQNVNIVNFDYKEILKDATIADFVFIDPPYLEDKNYDFEYNKDIVFDINELKDELDKLSKRNVKWLMTNIDTKQVRLLFQEYNIKEYINNNSINCNSKGKKELIIYNY